jgi:hypothetical protein
VAVAAEMLASVQLVQEQLQGEVQPELQALAEVSLSLGLAQV